MIVNLDSNQDKENKRPNIFILQLITGKIICKIENLISNEIIDPCEIQYMQSPQGLMINFLPVGMFTGGTRLNIGDNNIIWMEQAKESMIDSYKKALQDFKLKGGKTEESDIIIAEKIILK
jgi:hypothetical protein